jgi:hypothetical protein
MAFVAMLSPLLRAGAVCARGDDGAVRTFASGERHEHGTDGRHEAPAGERGPGGGDSADHCATTTSCASAALGAEAAMTPSRDLAHVALPLGDARAPVALALAPEPPPPRA